ncbi:MAG: hypothetical protein ABEH90_08075 [Halolamina sp.]
MGEVVPAFRRSLATVTGAPGHSLLVFVGGAVVAVFSLVAGTIPLVGWLVNSIVVTPLFFAGLLGSADAARRGGSPVEGFRAALSDAGWSVVGAYALLTALWVGLAILVVVLVGVGALAVGVSAQAAGGMAQGGLYSAGGAVAVVVGLLMVGIVAVAALAVQFVAPAAVVAGTDAVGSLKTSYRFFRRKPLGVTGFGLVAAAFSGLALLVTVALAALGQAVAGETLALALGALGYLVAGVEVSAVFTVFMVTYFATTVTDGDLPDGHEWPDEADDDTGRFIVGDVNAAGDAGASSDGDGSEPADTSGFHVEMANESSGSDDGDRGESRNDDRDGWAAEDADDPER